MAKSRAHKTNIARTRLQQLADRRSFKTIKPATAVVKTSRHKQTHQQAHTQAGIGVYDAVLLVGEGDFSFARSLLDHHGHCGVDIVASSYDTEAEAMRKHVGAAENIARIRHLCHDETREEPECASTIIEAERTGGEEGGKKEKKDREGTEPSCLFGIDATRLYTYHKRLSRAGTGRRKFNKIIFNFPHTGGLSKDVNRQVRANQALLSSFFASAQQLLLVPDDNSCGPTSSSSSSSTTRSRGSKPSRTAAQGSHHQQENGAEQQLYDQGLKTRPSILVSLFEGEPYSLWNIRDVARTNGLVVRRSWRFNWDDWPGYDHVRTLGTVVGRDGQESASAWKGRGREARMYEFMVGDKDGHVHQHQERETSKRKKHRIDDSSDEGD